MHYLSSDLLSALHLNWFDMTVLVWLIIGLFMGRKHGMSQELLPLTQWIAVVVIASLFYKVIAYPLSQRTGLTLLPCALAAYVFIGCLVYGLLGNLKKKLDDKFQEGDYFGKGEYYLGMASGVIRFTCILICLLAVMNTRIITKSERDATLKMQKQNFEDIHFPTYGEIQYDMLFESSTGNFVRAYLPHFLITPVNANDAPEPHHLSLPKIARSTPSSDTGSSGKSSSEGGGLKITFNK